MLNFTTHQKNVSLLSAQRLREIGFSLFCAVFACWCVFSFDSNHPLVWMVQRTFQKKYQFPLLFWLGGVVLFFIYRQLDSQVKAKEFFVEWGILHVCLLLVQFLQNKDASQLTSKAFQIYCILVPVIFLSGTTLFLFKNFPSRSPFLIAVPFACVFFLPYTLSLPILTLAVLGNFLPKDLLHKRTFAFLKSETFWVTVVFVLGATLRISGALRLGQMGDHLIMINSDDGDGYYQRAMQVLKGETVTSQLTLGYVATLAFFLNLAGKVLAHAIVLQSVIASFIPLIVYLLVRKTMGFTIALISMLLVALSQIMIFNSFNLAREFTAAFFLVLLVSQWKRVMQDNKLTQWLGITFFTFALYVNDSAYLPVLALVSLCSLFFFKSWSRYKGLISMICAYLISTLFFKQFTGEISFAGRDARILHSMMTQYTQNGDRMVELGIHPVLAVLKPIGFISGFISSPGESIQLIANKFQYDFQSYFLGGYLGGFDPLVLVKHTVLSSVLNVYFAVLVVAGFYSVFKQYLQTRSKFLLLLMVFTFGHGMTYVILFSGWTRFRGTALPLILLFAAIGLVQVLSASLNKQTAR